MTHQTTAQPPLPKVLWALVVWQFRDWYGRDDRARQHLSVDKPVINVPVPVAGQLISAGALLMCIGAPCSLQSLQLGIDADC